MSPREVRCACGAINDVTFGTCIRCGAQLSADGQAEAARAREPDKQRIRISTRAPGAEESPSFGRAALVLGGLCTLVFALQMMLALKRGGSIPLLSSGHGADALRVGALLTADVVVRSEPFRILSAVFVHFGLLHFGLNMYGFISLARSSESFVGSARTVIAFLVTGIAGNLATLGYQQLSGGTPMLTAGASGGILGVMGLLIGVLIRRGDQRWKNLAINTLFLAVMFGFAVNASNSGVLINNAAHIGGLVTGFVLGLAWSRGGAAEPTRTKVIAGVLLLASIASLLLSIASDLPNAIEGR